MDKEGLGTFNPIPLSAKRRPIARGLLWRGFWRLWRVAPCLALKSRVAGVTDGKQVIPMKRQVRACHQTFDMVDLLCRPGDARPLMVAVRVLANGIIGQHLLADDLPSMG